jgi:hypothetical protein
LKGGDPDGGSLLFQVSGEKGDQEPPERCAQEQAASNQRGLPGLRDKGVPDWQVLIAVSIAVWQ